MNDKHKIKLTDQELLEELKLRFEQNNATLKQLEELNEKLIDSEMIKTHFLSNIQNEINNPITAILGLSSGILERQDEREYVANSSRLIYFEAFQLNFQLRNILMAAQIEAGYSYPEISMVDLEKLIQQDCAGYTFLADKKNMRLELKLNKLPVFKTDSVKFSMILENLLSNAIKFGHEDSCITISAVVEDSGSVKLSVEDVGQGVDEAKAGVIFDRFKQLENGTTKKFAGHGLGLSIVSSLAEILGGKVDVKCGSGKGCEFIVVIPEAEEGTGELSEAKNSFLFFDEMDNDEEIF